MQAPKEELRIVFQRETITSQEIFTILIKVLESTGITFNFNLDKKSISLNEATPVISKNMFSFTPISSNGLSFSFSQVFNQEICTLSIKEIDTTATDWDCWVTPFLKYKSFIQAWISNIEYDFWQNTKDPLIYELENKPYKHLPMKSNGLPFPLERLEIDISNNPARWEFREDYVEAIGPQMWFGQLFLNKFGDKIKKSLRNNPNIEIIDLDFNSIKIQLKEMVSFNKSNIDHQIFLRKALYR